MEEQELVATFEDVQRVQGRAKEGRLTPQDRALDDLYKELMSYRGMFVGDWPRQVDEIRKFLEDLPSLPFLSMEFMAAVIVFMRMHNYNRLNGLPASIAFDDFEIAALKPSFVVETPLLRTKYYSTLIRYMRILYAHKQATQKPL